jgi:hypothetical protein
MSNIDNCRAGEIRKLRQIRSELRTRMEELWSWCLDNIDHPEWIMRKREYNNLSVKIDHINQRIKNLKSGHEISGALQEQSWPSGYFN